MRKIILFNLMTLDGFFEGPDHDLSWHGVDDEFNVFAAEQLQQTGLLLFGKTTYELMEGFWPSYVPEDEENRIVRDQMNALPKIVYSKTLPNVSENENWKNIMLLREVDSEEVNKLKQQDGKDILMLGSAKLAKAFLVLGLIDEIRVLVNPIILGQGTPLFKSGQEKLNLELMRTREFKNGNVLLCYQFVTK